MHQACTHSAHILHIGQGNARLVPFENASKWRTVGTRDKEVQKAEEDHLYHIVQIQEIIASLDHEI